MVAIFSVQDVGEFRAYHPSTEDLRREHGRLQATVSQEVEDPNTIVLLLDFPTTAQATAYLEAAIAEGGVERSILDGLPRVEIYDEPVREGL